MRTMITICALAAAAVAQPGWQQDADVGRTSVGACTWCDTSVIPNEVYTFGGSEDTLAVTRYHKTATGWQWDDTPYDSPSVYNRVQGTLQTWWEGKAEFLEKDSQGRTVNRAVCISAIMMAYRGFQATIITEVWEFDRASGFSKPFVDPLNPDNPPSTSFAGTATTGGKLFMFGNATGSLSQANSDMFVLDRTAPGVYRWERREPIGNPPPPLAQCHLTAVGPLLVVHGGYTNQLMGPPNKRTWITVADGVGGKQLWIEIGGPYADNLKRQGTAWYDPTTGALLRFGTTTQFERHVFDHTEFLHPSFGSTWHRMPAVWPSPPGRWRCSGTWMPSEGCFLMLGGYTMSNGVNLRLFTDSWRFEI